MSAFGVSSAIGQQDQAVSPELLLQREDALKAKTTDVDSKLSTELVLRARTNYAVALIDHGRVEQAIKQYAEKILIAIEHDIDSITLHAPCIPGDGISL